MAAAAAPPGAVLGRLPDFPDRTAVPVGCRGEDGREVAVVVVRRGAEWFAQACAEAGVDGVICVDIPAEEDAALGPALRAAGLAPIRLATPTTDAARLPAVLEGAGGFLYYVSVAGITGKQQATATSIADAVRDLKAATDLPVAAYSVSGEYAMIKAAAQNGWLDEKTAVLEALTGVKRAGADVIVTYFAPDVARWML